MEKVSNELRQKRGLDSLQDLHAKKLKKARTEEEEKAGTSAAPERRTFDRDVDLQANRFDNAQKELMIKKARELNDRFAKGSNKFL